MVGRACVPGPVRVVDVDVAVECSSNLHCGPRARDASAALGLVLTSPRCGGRASAASAALDELAAVEDEGVGSSLFCP